MATTKSIGQNGILFLATALFVFYAVKAAEKYLNGQTAWTNEETNHLLFDFPSINICVESDKMPKESIVLELLHIMRGTDKNGQERFPFFLTKCNILLIYFLF